MAVIGGTFQCGWNLALFNTPFEAIKLFFENTYEERYGKKMSSGTFDLLWSITNGIFPLGGVFGAFASGYVGDFFGRKLGLVLTNILVLMSFILNVISKPVKAYETLIASRFISGVFCGLLTGILPLYLNEISPQNYRGIIGGCTQIFYVFGILITNIFGLPEILGSYERWPYLLGLMILPVFAHVILFFLAESPKYLYIRKNKTNEAENVLKKLRGHNSEELIKNELILLERERIELLNVKSVRWLDLIKQSSLRHPLFIALGISVATQFTGINAVMFYSTTIFKNVGLIGQWPQYATIILGVVHVAITVASSGLMERTGRKNLLLIGFLGNCISSFLLAIFRIIGEKSGLKVFNYLTVVVAVSFIIFYAIGPGPVLWLITPELFGSNARAKANSLAVLGVWGSAIIVIIGFPFLESAIKNYSFVLFGGLCAIFFVFILFFLPETKNKSHEQINDILASRTIFVFNRKQKLEIF